MMSSSCFVRGVCLAFVSSGGSTVRAVDYERCALDFDFVLGLYWKLAAEL